MGHFTGKLRMGTTPERTDNAYQFLGTFHKFFDSTPLPNFVLSNRIHNFCILDTSSKDWYHDKLLQSNHEFTEFGKYDGAMSDEFGQKG